MKSKKKTKATSKRPTSKRGASKTRKKKLVMAALAAGTVGIVGYFGWQLWNRKRQNKANADIDAILKQNNSVIEHPTITTPAIVNKPKTKPVSTYKYTSPAINDTFPLKKGSKGEIVRQLQEALIAKNGKSILPRYGADGDFGSETVNALKKLGYPSSINESTFNVITAASKIDAATVGKELYSATTTKNFNAALSSLKKLKSTEDYSIANDVFKSSRTGSVHKTIVNGLLDTFSTTTQKDSIKQEFLRIGLQYDGSKWSLSGLDGISLITTEPTTVWVNANESVKVPARMVLGAEISRRLDYTLFENKGKYFLVNTKSVQYL